MEIVALLMFAVVYWALGVMHGEIGQAELEIKRLQRRVDDLEQCGKEVR